MIKIENLLSAFAKANSFEFSLMTNLKTGVWILFFCLLSAGCNSLKTAPQAQLCEPYLFMESESITVPLSSGKNSQWLVRAIVNGHPGEFILDTGAEFTSITPEFAEKLKLTGDTNPNSLFTKISSTSKQIQNVAISSFKVGELEYFNFYAAILDLKHINQAVHSEIAGILGNNLLNQTAYTINWKSNTLTFTTRLQKPPAGALPISIRTNRVFLNVEVNGKSTEFALDTGAYRSLLSTRDMNRLEIPANKKQLVEAPEIDIEKSLSQKQTVATLDHLKVGLIDRKNFPIMVWSHSVLGMDLLKPYILTVDARRNWLLLSESPNQAVSKKP
jgi:predicted aspartyl protease